MEKTKIAFFFPDKNLGGGPFYLMRLASFLSKNNKYEIYYIDYADGFSHEVNVDKKNINFINYIDNCSRILINEPCFLFAPVYYLHNFPVVHPDSKVLFFNWHNLCLPVLKNNLGITDKELKPFLKMMYKNNAEVFCDGAHREANNRFSKLNFRPNYVPIIVEHKKFIQKEIISDDEINIAFLGRLVIDKIQSINNFVYNAENLNYDKKINVHIIGDGPDKNKIILPKGNNIRLIFCGVYKNEALDNYLLNNIDILFAMGTSVMEGAALGIPSIIVSADIEAYYTNKFVWFFDAENYCLGWDNCQIDNNSKNQYTLEEIINQIYRDSRKLEIGKKCFDYCITNFSYEFSGNKLERYLFDTKLKYKDVDNYIKKIRSPKKTPILKQCLKKLQKKLFINALSYKLDEQKVSLENDMAQKLEVQKNSLENSIAQKLEEQKVSLENDMARKLEEQKVSLENDMARKLEEQKVSLENGMAQKLEEQKVSLENDMAQKLEELKIAASYQIQLQMRVLSLHKKVFPKYKNINAGKTIVILASGPTVKYYEAIKDSINISVNGSYIFDKINFDYYFAADYKAIKSESIHKIPNVKNLQNAIKFYGIFTPEPEDMIIPESYAIRDNAERYYSFSVCYDSNNKTKVPYIKFPLDLSSEFLINHGTIAHDAFQFALYTHPSKIYLVGCDCTANGHFFNNSEKQDTDDREVQILVLGWKKLAEFAKIHYPDIEIISVNPVGLKGVFNDLYQTNTTELQ